MGDFDSLRLGGGEEARALYTSPTCRGFCRLQSPIHWIHSSQFTNTAPKAFLGDLDFTLAAPEFGNLYARLQDYDPYELGDDPESEEPDELKDTEQPEEETLIPPIPKDDSTFLPPALDGTPLKYAPHFSKHYETECEELIERCYNLSALCYLLVKGQEIDEKRQVNLEFQDVALPKH